MITTIARLLLIVGLILWIFSGGISLGQPPSPGTPPVQAATDPAPAAGTPTEPVPPPAQASADRLYIGETGHLIGGAFLNVWRTGRVDAYGYPLTEEFNDQCEGRPCIVQYFEKARFEFEPTTSTVYLGLLGREYLNGRTFEREAPFPNGTDRWYFEQTGQGLGFGFLQFWLTNDGARRLGLPVSPELSEESRTVQYFERGRLDFFADRPPGERVSIAPLGRPVVERRWVLPATVELSLSAPAVAQGRPLALVVHGAATAGAEFAGTALPLSRLADGSWRGIVGVAPWDEAGPRSLRLIVTAGDGTARRLERSLEVVPFDFPRERLVIPPGQRGLLDPAVRDRELAAVRPLYAIMTPEPLWSGTWRWPLEGRITTEFATRRAYNDGPYNEYHGGVDIAAPIGTPVVAPAAGRVVYADTLPIRGNFIAIDHGLGLLTAYFHLSAIEVSVGQQVKPGDQIGRVGTTGLSTGPHLHWEARVAGTPVEPRTWLNSTLLP